MKIIKIDRNNPDHEAIKMAASVMENDGIIIYPTDTAYAIGGNAFKRTVIQKVYSMKARDFNKPTHVVVRDWDMIASYTWPNDHAKILYDNLMPGPLTLLLTKKSIFLPILTGGLKTIGVRVPKCEVTRVLSETVFFPYTTPSANFTGGKTPYSIDEVKNELHMWRADLVLDAGELPRVPTSTIVDTTTVPSKIVRLGGITKEEIEKFLVVQN